MPLRASSSEERRQRSEATPMASPGTGAPVTLRVPLGRPRRRLGGEDGTGVGSAEDADATSDEVGSAVPTDAPGATSEEGAPSPSPSPSRARSDTARESRARATADPPGRAASSLATSRDRGHVPSNPSRRDQRTGGRRSLTRAGVTREGAPLATKGSPRARRGRRHPLRRPRARLAGGRVPSSPRASRGWACPESSPRIGKDSTAGDAARCAGYTFANMGPHSRARWVYRPPPTAARRAFPYFFPVRRAQNARRTFDAHARARHERAHFHPSRTSPFAMGKDKSMKDVGAAQVRAPPLARSLPPRHRPPPFPTNISGA